MCAFSKISSTLKLALINVTVLSDQPAQLPCLFFRNQLLKLVPRQKVVIRVLEAWNHSLFKVSSLIHLRVFSSDIEETLALRIKTKLHTPH